MALGCLGVGIKASCSESMHFCKKQYPYLKQYKHLFSLLLFVIDQVIVFVFIYLFICIFLGCFHKATFLNEPTFVNASHIIPMQLVS